MIYTADIKTLKKPDYGKIKHTVLSVTKGLVYKVEFNFPPGPGGLVGVAVFDGLYQVWPSSVGEFFVSDDETISFDDMYIKEAAPYQFDIYTYNDDEANDHTVRVRIGLVSNEVFMERFLPTKGRAYFEKLRTRMIRERVKRAEMQRALIEAGASEWLNEQQTKAILKEKSGEKSR